MSPPFSPCRVPSSRPSRGSPQWVPHSVIHCKWYPPECPLQVVPPKSFARRGPLQTVSSQGVPTISLHSGPFQGLPIQGSSQGFTFSRSLRGDLLQACPMESRPGCPIHISPKEGPLLWSLQGFRSRKSKREGSLQVFTTMGHFRRVPFSFPSMWSPPCVPLGRPLHWNSCRGSPSSDPDQCVPSRWSSPGSPLQGSTSKGLLQVVQTRSPQIVPSRGPCLRPPSGVLSMESPPSAHKQRPIQDAPPGNCTGGPMQGVPSMGSLPRGPLQVVDALVVTSSVFPP